MITIITGSQRPRSQSAKVAAFVQMLLDRRTVGAHAVTLETGLLPLWTDDPEAQAAQVEAWAPVATMIRASDALVLVAPEWNGMAPPALKNFFLYCTSHELADRPALIVGLSSGHGGSAPASELRLSSYRDTQICYIPEQVIVRRVTEVLNEPEPVSEDDAYIRFRLDYALGILIEYGAALAQVRSSGARNFELIPYGM
ncbi:NADPH-dependent FMN reductase [Sphingomonas alpina]|uniref:NAD(P)H-dependent oxidoreductase n=1 Tax=Sphingomonas alpina TaxID=653931 RepID=A0A7H0LFQ1_9SPHN|nr:NAD(P)H-dependent oxidoreductase [Sphingomonas alpina]QNQ08504.1 NAD(P)H-dependent oxidoreductase [Sphingomonas alpina]